MENLKYRSPRDDKEERQEQRKLRVERYVHGPRESIRRYFNRTDIVKPAPHWVRDAAFIVAAVGAVGSLVYAVTH
ncbi:hypothetical protein KW805_05030 [Candidatus Pacearchaeota archaeon]|nr:hypothetical protein [Candidatus Pacearchaeota archaeon]